ncbi:MAG: tetratricopeptide repeat protein [Gemmatimonadota bacterium]
MKKQRRYSAKRRTPSRRWHIPPPLIHGPETLEGGGILQEWGNELGVVLWQASRDVMLWATTEPESRAEIFASCGSPSASAAARDFSESSDSRFRNGLRTLRQMVEQPVTVRDEQVARACRQISEWADDQGRLGTALAFAQDAALAAGHDAAAAFWVATVAVRLNDHARAEVWFRRAVGLARQSRDWRMYSRSFGGLGNLYIRRGNLPDARRLHTRALRGARRGGMRREQAAALHDLFAVAVETGCAAEAERLARQALDVYGTRNRRVHVLAHDVAYFWMEQGHFGRALPVFQAVLPLIERPIERLFVLADIARAAGGIGDATTANSAAAEVWTSASETELQPGAARALLEVARGELSLRSLAAAEAAARKSLELATQHRESKIRFAAEALLESLSEDVEQTVPSHRSPEPTDQGGDELAAEFVRTLEVIAGAAE